MTPIEVDEAGLAALIAQFQQLGLGTEDTAADFVDCLERAGVVVVQ